MQHETTDVEETQLVVKARHHIGCKGIAMPSHLHGSASYQGLKGSTGNKLTRQHDALTQSQLPQRHPCCRQHGQPSASRRLPAKSSCNCSTASHLPWKLYPKTSP